MKHPVVLLLALVVVMVAATGVAFAQTGPQFKLGFKALADQIPGVVGQPVENEHSGPNGDSLQRTTTGMMVWRKADNWTAFTDGATTWTSSAVGVLSRPNDRRFCWEADAEKAVCTEECASTLVGVTSLPAPAAGPPVAASPASPTPSYGSSGDTIRWVIDSPRQSERVLGCVAFVGWAVDTRSAGHGWSGIDAVEVYVGAPRESRGWPLDTRVERSQRPDVASALGHPAYAASGLNVQVNCSGLAGGLQDFYVHVHSALSGWSSKRVGVYLQPRSSATAASMRTIMWDGIKRGISPDPLLVRLALPALHGDAADDPAEVERERAWIRMTIEECIRMGIAPDPFLYCFAYPEMCTGARR